MDLDFSKVIYIACYATADSNPQISLSHAVSRYDARGGLCQPREKSVFQVAGVR